MSLEHLPCPKCGSHDALTMYDDGHSFCFSCNTYFPKGTQGIEATATAETAVKHDVIPSSDLEFKALGARGITMATCQKYGYGQTTYKGEGCQVANYYDDNGNCTGQKLRFKDKKFQCLGKVGDRFYGQNLWQGGRKLVVTEGEIDCLTVSQLNDNKYPVVSIPNGAQSAKRVFLKNMEWLNSFDEVIVMFDMDEAGRKATESVCGVLELGKLKIATLPLKDANECLQKGMADEVIKAIWNAKQYRPDGIVNGDELWNIIDSDDDEAEGYSLPWQVPLQEMTGGIHKGELIVVTAGTGIGKTTFVRQIAHHLGVDLKLKVGMMMLEENIKRTARGLMAITAGKRLALNRDLVSEDEYKEIFDRTLADGHFCFYQHFGSLDNTSLLQRMRYLAVAEKCDFIVLDHITIAISGLDIDNERKATDVLMTQLRSLVEETGVGMFVISHLSRKEGVPAEEGGKVTLAHLRGSHALAQLSDGVWALERNQQASSPEEKNLMDIRVLKNRRTGETGLAGHLLFNKETDRLEATEKQRHSIAEVFNNEQGEF